MTKTEIAVSDIKREMRWGYKDQSTSNLLRLIDSLKAQRDARTAAVVQAASNYVGALIAASRAGFDPASVGVLKLSAYRLSDTIRYWETAQA